jgi:1-deoxy-D-xylulose-5-phosphate synthase
MCDGTGLTEFSKRFPDRFYDVGIAESAAVDIAAGMAKAGLRPFVCIYSTFLQRSFDQIYQEVALQNLPVVFCIDRAGLVGADGPTHHGLMDIGYLRMMPNIILAAVANENEMLPALEFALKTDKCVCIRYPREKISADDYDKGTCSKPFVLGKSITVRKAADSKLAVVSYGSVLGEAMKAAEELAKDDIEIEVINARFAAPIDDGPVKLLRDGKDIITVEDHSISCGFGSALLEAASRQMALTEGGKYLREGRIRLLGVGDAPVERASRKEQLIEAGISADNIKTAVMQMLEEKIKKSPVVRKKEKKGALK